MISRRDFLKQVAGAVVAPVVPVPELKLKPRSVGASWSAWGQVSPAQLAWYVEMKRQEKIHQAFAAGHRGPWTFQYTPQGRKLLDGKGVACG